MKSKIVFLITGCIFTVIALAAIQGFFIYNTYHLKEKEVNEAIRKQLLDFEDTPEYYAIDDAWMQLSGKFLSSYMKGKASKADFVAYTKQKSDSLSPILAKAMSRSGLYKKYKIGYSVYIISVTTPKGISTDTIFNGKIKTLGNNIKSDNEILYATGNWETRDDTSHSGQIRTLRCYSIENWRITILSEMAGLLFFTVVLLAFVMLLFYLSIRNIITQKKLSDIKTDFINNITHEFQTPLATMDIAVKTLQRKGENLQPDHFERTLLVIERQNARLQTLFGQVTEASLTSTQITETKNQPVTCEDVKEIVADFKMAHPLIAINCYEQDKNVTIGVSRFHLNTIMINLLDNAIKYGADTIDIRLAIGNNQSQIIIKDNGQGIPAKHLPVIFDKFYRVQKGNIQNTKGLGLGLFYVKQITEAYNGNVTVSSTGNGAEFTISIPLA
jgi:two-component system phosphate regulon sensor histidine kinase PhoR